MNILSILECLYWPIYCACLFIKTRQKVCKATALRSCHCFPCTMLPGLNRANWLPENKSYSALLLTAAERCKKLGQTHFNFYLVQMKEFLSDVNNDLPLDTRWLSNIPDQTSWRQLPDRNINFCKYFREKSF